MDTLCTRRKISDLISLFIVQFSMIFCQAWKKKMSKPVVFSFLFLPALIYFYLHLHRLICLTLF